MMTSPRCYLAAAVLLLLTSTRTEAQPPAATAAGGRLELTTTSEPARTAFRTAWFNQQNVDPAGARAEVAKAIAADPRFGLAQAFQGFLGTGAAERERAINTALTNMGGASVPELLLALYWREAAAGRGPIAAQLLGILVPLVPGDPEIAYVQFTAQNTGTPAVRSQNFRTFLQRFPQHAAAHNNAAYTHWQAGDGAAALAAAEEYLRLAPQHANAHDTYADILMLLQRPQDAAPHAQRALEIGELPGPQMKLGAIRLMQNDAAGARTYFETGRDAATGFPARLPFLRWIAVSYLYANQGKTAVQSMEQIATEAQAASDPTNVAIAHDWAGVIEAYTGNRRAVAAHVNAAATAVTQPGAGHYVNKAIAYARAGDPEQARGALAQLTTMAPNNANIPLVTAILALDAKDLPAAEAALAQAGPTNLLANALRAELMIRKGQRREGLALRDAVLASPVKVDGNPPVDFSKVVARLRAQQLR